MERWMKYTGIGVGLAFLLLVVTTVIVLPLATNMQRYLPQLEDKLSSLTGRPVAIGSDLALYFFPSPGISFSDLQIGNPEGYHSDALIKIASCEARFALLPLLKKEVAISRLIISGLEVSLEKRTDGRGNWDFSQQPSTEGSSAGPVAPVAGWALPQGVTVDLLVVTDGVVHWLDIARQVRHSFDDLMFIAHDFNFDDPVAVEFKVTIAGNALAAEGTVGPFVQRSAHGPLPVALATRFIDSFSGQIKGKTTEPQEDQGADFVLQVPPFSARDLFSFPVADVPASTVNGYVSSNAKNDLSSDVSSEAAKIQSVESDISETEERDKVGTGKIRIYPLQIEENRRWK